ncbi:MAG: beta-ketoacyl-ACP synthase III [Terriglobia bacterium]
MRAGIVGLGSYLPEKRLTNHELEKMVDTTDEWIRTRTGIEERRLVGPDEQTSDLGAHAGKMALKAAGLEPGDIDLVIVATSSPEMVFPSTACITQAKIGLAGCPAFDVAAACSSFIYGLVVADSLVSGGSYQNVLLIGADALTRHVDWEDRNTCVLFGDGAGAAVLRPVEDGFGVLSSYLAADGSGADLLKIPAGGSRHPGSIESVKGRQHTVSMNGNEVFRFAARVMPQAVEKVTRDAGITLEQVKYIVPHQANQRIIEAAGRALKVGEEKIFSNIRMLGNTSAASIPLALDDLIRAGQIGRGDYIVLVGFGAGLTWGATLIRWS